MPSFCGHLAIVRAAIGMMAGGWLLAASVASAQVSLLPDAQGYVGAVLVAGPVRPHPNLEGADPRLHQALPNAPWVRWRLLSVASGPFDLGRLAGSHQGALVLLGGVLVAKHQTETLLLLSVDGTARVIVDGHAVWHTDGTRSWGSSWDLVPLRLDTGKHVVLVALERRGKRHKCELRLLDPGTFLPPKVQFMLPGTGESEAQGLLESMLSVSIDPGLQPSGYRPVVTAQFQRGVPSSPDLSTVIEVARGHAQASRGLLLRRRAGVLSRTTRAVYPLTAKLPLLAIKRDEKLNVRIRVGSAQAKRTLWASPKVPNVLESAYRHRSRLMAGTTPWLSDPLVVAATLDHRLTDVKNAVSKDRGSWSHVWRALDSVQSLLTDLEQGKDPLHGPGVLELARRTVLDGQPDPILVHVPRDYTPNTDRKYPLVLALHGLNGSPRGILRAFLDSASDRPVARVDGFVAALNAYGNAFYRGPGEYAVLDALGWLRQTYPIDQDRVSITGVSMGGTGTAELALRHSDVFAAAAPLCGYHSYFLRRDVRGAPLKSWERSRVRYFSPVAWADNGQRLPMFVAHGTLDLPLSNSRVLVDRYRELGYSMTAEWPSTGHSVWKVSYAQARLWGWLTSHRRDPAPTSITLKTDTLRYGRRAWVEVMALEQPGGAGLVHASYLRAGQFEVRTKGVVGLRILREISPSPRGQPVELRVDGVRLHFSADEPTSVRRVNGQWTKGQALMVGEKRAGLEGPLRDVFSGPLVFVYGSGDRATLRANCELANKAARLGFGGNVRYPVIADRELTSAVERSSAVFVVGTPRDTQILRELGRRLPFRVNGDRVCSNRGCFSGPEVGAVFVYPNPRANNQYIAVLTAPHLAGLFRALSLPRLLPDFVVYDHGIAPAAGQQVLGTARALAAGFFERDWSLPNAEAL